MRRISLRSNYEELTFSTNYNQLLKRQASKFSVQQQNAPHQKLLEQAYHINEQIKEEKINQQSGEYNQCPNETKNSNSEKNSEIGEELQLFTEEISEIENSMLQNSARSFLQTDQKQGSKNFEG